MAATSQCHITAVLLCMGRGGDPNAFRPNRDESQWWSRRDALVRCVASFLFGPTSADSKDMILLFDDDRAKIYLSMDGATSYTFPSEQTILALFKKAAQSPGTRISKDGLSCRVVLPDPTLVNNNGNPKSSGGSELPTGLDSKRDLLAYLQKHCSMEFLRNNGLNSAPTVLLRKTNKKALMDIWNKWRSEDKTQNSQSKESTKKHSANSSTDAAVIESLFSEIISSKVQQEPREKSIVGTLHETCEEFPCFFDSKKEDDVACTKFRVMLFLGAVRDMTKQENAILSTVCRQLGLPLVGIRFGTVPEFTSKILSILALHHSSPKIMNGALNRLLEAQGKGALSVTSPSTRMSSCLHLICLVPMATRDFASDLSRRDRLHWCVVRVVVCTLWRSRLASSDMSAKVGHTNTLTLVFDDGVSLYLTEESFVSSLATQHQAAPTEFQILAAVRALLNTNPNPPDDWNRKELAAKVVERIIQSSPIPVTATISISHGEGEDKELLRQFYSSAETNDYTHTSTNSVIAILSMTSNNNNNVLGNPTAAKIGRVHRAIVSAAEKQTSSAVHDSILTGGTDYEAACIICLQHFLYQHRLFLKTTKHGGKKRKKHS